MAAGHNNNWVTLYNSRAHVFQINAETKTSWLPKGDSAIPIFFVATINSPESPIKRELKLIGANELGQTVLDAIILPKTIFQKRSQKFGQWTDQTGMVYGLGFNSENELNEFVDTFQQLQRDILSPQTGPGLPPDQSIAPKPQGSERMQGWNKSQQPLNNTSEMINGRVHSVATTTNKPQIDNSGQNIQYSNTLAHPGHQQAQIRRQQASQGSTIEQDANLNNGNGLDGGGRVTPEGDNSTLSQGAWQLKYENERLKQALEESSKNAGIWNNELINLRTNNVKLTQALQESKAHVEEWERELFGLRDENKELKLRVLALESANNPENEQTKDLQKYKNYVDEIQSELKKKDDQLESLRKAMEELEVKAAATKTNGQSEDVVSAEVAISSHQKQKFDVINAKLEAKISELVTVQKEFAQLVDKIY